jgi:hypothetical protein
MRPPRIRAQIVPVDGVADCAFDLADLALASGRPTGCPDCPVVAVPDVVIVEGKANGDAVPETYRLVRADGREAWIYRRGTTA